MGDEPDVFDILSEDHGRIRALLARLEADPGTPAPGVLDELRREMSVHSAVEIEHLYPFAAHHLDDGVDVAKQGRLDHEELDMTLYRLLEVVDTDAGFRAELTKLVADTAAHFEQEDQLVFPALRRRASAQELADLGIHIEHAKRHAPTHPHPSAPKSAMASRLAHRLVGAFDRMRDRRRP